MMTFQELVGRLNDYWSQQGCAILQPYDVEVGAGTMHPATTLRCLGPEAWNVAYVQPSRRPADGRFTRNPMRSQRYFQYQVIMKPSPDNIVDLYMGSLDALGFDTKKNDVRLVEDDWESQAAGAAGVVLYSYHYLGPNSPGGERARLSDVRSAVFAERTTTAPMAWRQEGGAR